MEREVKRKMKHEFTDFDLTNWVNEEYWRKSRVFFSMPPDQHVPSHIALPPFTGILQTRINKTLTIF